MKSKIFDIPCEVKTIYKIECLVDMGEFGDKKMTFYFDRFEDAKKFMSDNCKKRIIHFEGTPGEDDFVIYRGTKIKNGFEHRFDLSVESLIVEADWEA